MENMDKIDNIVQNYVNGNITYAKNAVKRLNKLEILEFVTALADYYGTDGALMHSIDTTGSLLQ